jgi:hypothetical protein
MDSPLRNKKAAGTRFFVPVRLQVFGFLTPLAHPRADDCAYALAAHAAHAAMTVV